MSDIVDLSRATGSAGALELCGLPVAMATGQVEWPGHTEKAYTLAHVRSSSSPIVQITPSYALQSAEEQFIGEISDVYRTLLQEQEPLGAEFEAVWDANVESLYKA